MTFSVRFFKRLILLVLLLMIIVPTCFAFFYWHRAGDLERQLTEQGANPGQPSHSQESADPTQDPAVVPTSYDTTLEGEPLRYQTLFPELYGTASVSGGRTSAIDTVYLTFDCTPSSNTLEILDKLDDYGIKATFFINGDSTDPDAQEIMREIVNQGHTIGLRSYSNSYDAIYHSVEDYLTDFNEIYNLVYETTGVRAEIFSFPGGSVNSYNDSIYQELIAEMLRRNFVFFDWNFAGDSTGSRTPSAEEISANVINGMADKDRAIIKFRDAFGREAVAGAIPAIVDKLQSLGYSFQPLTASVRPIVWSYSS